MNALRFTLLASLICTLSAQAGVNVQVFELSSLVPDNDDTGLVDVQNFNNPSLDTIESVEIGLEFSGGWNGDLYAYLVHDSNIAILLNRPGREVGTPDGSASSGMNITLSELATSDIHTAIPMSGTDILGAYKSDGRNVDPLSVVGSDLRTATLDSFAGLDPNGTWTLFVADQAAGSTSTLESWTLTITAVPEPSQFLLLLSCFSIALIRRRRSLR